MSSLEKAFELSVVIHAVDKLTGPLLKTRESMALTQKQIDAMQKKMKDMGKSDAEIKQLTKSFKDLGDTSARIEKLTKAMDAFKKSALAGAAITAGGVAMAGGLMHAAEEAGKLLTIMTTIEGATGATAKQMQDIQNTIRHVSSEVKYDKIETSKFAATLGTSGYNQKEIIDLLPTFAKFAEVQEYGKGVNPEESIKQAIQLAHGFGHYDSASLMTFLNQYNKATFMQPEDSTKFGETLKYTMTTAKTMGMSDSDTLYMAALANRMGLAGSMGGTNAADMLMRAIPGISGGLTRKKDGSYPKQLQAMMDMGLADAKGNSPFFDQSGKLIDLQGFITKLGEAASKMNPKDRMLHMHDIFGIQGARAANLFGSDKGLEQLAALNEGNGRIKSIDQMQEDYLKTPEGQINQWKANLQNLKFTFFLELAKTMTPLIKDMTTFVSKVTEFTNQHPKIAQTVAKFAVFGTIIALAAGPLVSLISLIGMMTTALRILNIGSFIMTVMRLTGVLRIWSAIQTVLNILMLTNPLMWIVIGVGALIGGIVLLILHWKEFISWMEKSFPWFVQFEGWLNKLGTWLKNLGQMAADAGRDFIQGFLDGMKKMYGALESGVKTVSDKVVTGFKTLLGIHSPSRVMMEHGKFVSQGLALGIQQNTGMVSKATLGLSRQVNGLSLTPGASAGSQIIINPHPHQRAEEIADEVMRRLGPSARSMAMNTGMRVNINAMG